jgi:hypothetical protein
MTVRRQTAQRYITGWRKRKNHDPTDHAKRIGRLDPGPLLAPITAPEKIRLR